MNSENKTQQNTKLPPKPEPPPIEYIKDGGGELALVPLAFLFLIILYSISDRCM